MRLLLTSPVPSIGIMTGEKHRQFVATRRDRRCGLFYKCFRRSHFLHLFGQRSNFLNIVKPARAMRQLRL